MASIDPQHARDDSIELAATRDRREFDYANRPSVADLVREMPSQLRGLLPAKDGKAAPERLRWIDGSVHQVTLEEVGGETAVHLIGHHWPVVYNPAWPAWEVQALREEGLYGGLDGGAPWPTSLRLRMGANEGETRGPLQVVTVPRLPAAPADDDAQAARTELVQAMTSKREPGRRDGQKLSFQSRLGSGASARSVDVTLHLDARDRVSDVVLGRASTASYASFMSTALADHLRATLGAEIDRVVALKPTRLTPDVQVMACALDATCRYLREAGLDPADDPNIDRYVAVAADVAQEVARARPGLVEAADQIAANFKPQACAALAVLREDFDNVDALRPIAMANRWRMFVDPVIVETVSDCGIDTADNPLMLFLLDAEQPGYAYRYAGGLCRALQRKDEPVDLARFKELALDVCDQQEFAETVAWPMYCSDAGRADLVDLLELMVDPHGLSVKVSRFGTQDEVLLAPGETPVYRQGGTSGQGDTTAPEGGSTREVIEKLAPPSGSADVWLACMRSGTAQQIEDLVKGLLDDHEERAAALQRDAPAQASSDSDASDGETDAALGAAARMYAALNHYHPYANGTGRLSTTLVQVHLARHGKDITVFYDGMRTEGGSAQEIAQLILAGQGRVRSWHGA